MYLLCTVVAASGPTSSIVGVVVVTVAKASTTSRLSVHGGLLLFGSSSGVCPLLLITSLKTCVKLLDLLPGYRFFEMAH